MGFRKQDARQRSLQKSKHTAPVLRPHPPSTGQQPRAHRQRGSEGSLSFQSYRLVFIFLIDLSTVAKCGSVVASPPLAFFVYESHKFNKSPPFQKNAWTHIQNPAHDFKKVPDLSGAHPWVLGLKLFTHNTPTQTRQAGKTWPGQDRGGVRGGGVSGDHTPGCGF